MFSETWLSDSEQLNLDIQGNMCDHINVNKSTGAKKADIAVVHQYIFEKRKEKENKNS